VSRRFVQHAAVGLPDEQDREPEPRAKTGLHPARNRRRHQRPETRLGPYPAANLRKALRGHIGGVGVVRAFQIALPAIRAPTMKINVAR
jgi:hypothetical protein